MRADVGTVLCGRGANTSDVAVRRQEPLERDGRGAANAGGSWTQRDGCDAVPQERARNKLHRSGHLAIDAVGRERAVGLRHGRKLGSQ